MIKGLSDFNGDIDAFIEAVRKELQDGKPITEFARRQYIAAIQSRMTLKDKVLSRLKP